MTLDLTFGGRLRIPLIAAPMFLVSSPEMALAACSRGVMGSFPAHSTRTREVFAGWLDQMTRGMQELRDQGIEPAPYAVNLVVHRTNERYPGDLELCIQHEVSVILTSKGGPEDVFRQIHDYGGVAFHDIASRRHAEKALEAGADGLTAVCGGAGGHCGTLNPFALLNEVREITDKPIVLAGSLSTGRDIVAALAMGADLAYMGTRFIPVRESLASEDYRSALFGATAKDVLFTTALDGFPANFLAPSIEAAGLDLDEVKATPPRQIVDPGKARTRYKKIFSAGQGVGMVNRVRTTAELCDELIAQYEEARLAVRERLRGAEVVEPATSRVRAKKVSDSGSRPGERPVLGVDKGQFSVPEDFDAPLDKDLLRATRRL